tara:strand:+ start:145 stop:1326 length:1182 start_codon:yes stop_codon:yes gene_type:complete
MVNDKQNLHDKEKKDSFDIGSRSIIGSQNRSRFELLAKNKDESILFKPFFYVGFSLFLIICSIFIFFYVVTYVLPPMKQAIKVGEITYSRGDVVRFIRFNQRMSEDLGVDFEIGNSVFEALKTILEGELAYQVAPRYGISVSNERLDKQIEILMGYIDNAEGVEGSKEHKKNIEESYRQFLNKTSLSDYEYREYVKRTIFREELRSIVSRDVSRIQPHVNVYEIVFTSPDLSLVNAIEKKITLGNNIEEIALEFSEDKEVLRTKGNLGWLPKGINQELDKIFFGLNEDGSRTLPVGKLSEQPYYNNEAQVYAFYYISDYIEAREVTDKNFDLLTNVQFDQFINSFTDEYNLWIDIDSDIYNWINSKVLLASNAEFMENVETISESEGLQTYPN